jgi:integrase
VTIIRVKGFKIFLDRHKKTWRCYHRKTGIPIDLKKAPIGSTAFIAECARIAAFVEAKEAEKEKPGTLGQLIAEYRASSAFRALAPKTKRDYQTYFEYLRPIADTPLARFDRPLVVRIRDKAELKGRRFGNYVKAILSLLFAWGSERGLLVGNPASGIKDIRRPKDAPDANRPWSDTERHAILDDAPDHMRLAIALMMFTGLGPKDALTLPRTFAKSGEIATRRSKTGEPVFWPMPRPLADILARAPTHIPP